ncbi:branched-chain amino acid ABC transporter permease [soil metagenome]
MNFSTTVQLLVTGLALGAVYALIATGLYITHLTVDKVNFGQGDFVMAAAFLTLSTRNHGMPLLIAVPAVLLALMVIGHVLERVAIRPLERRRGSPVGAYAWILTTAGVAFIVQNIVELVYGKSAQYSPPLFSDDRNSLIHVGGMNIAVEELLVIVAAVAVAAAFQAFMLRSRWGKRIRAVAFNPDAAALLGIDTRLVKAIVWIIAALLAALAGVLIGPLVTVHPHMGLIFTIKALIVAAIGGLSNPIGILAGGLLFGVAEALSNYADSTFGDLYPLIAAMIIIVLRPSGLFAERSTDVR